MHSVSDTEQLLISGSAGALADAAAFLRCRTCTDGPADGEDRDFSRPEKQWAAFIDWAGSCGKFLPLDFPGPEREGGRKHDMTLDETTGRWVKYTKPSASGDTVSWREDRSYVPIRKVPVGDHLKYRQRKTSGGRDSTMSPLNDSRRVA